MKSHRLLWLVLAALSADCSGGTAGNEELFEVVQVNPAVLEDPISFTLEPDRSVELETNADVDARGRLTLRANAGTVDRITSLTVARFNSNNTPAGVLGSAFVLSPEGFLLQRSMRIRIALPKTVVANPATYRIARLDTGARYYRPLPLQANIVADNVVHLCGEIDSFGVFAVIDASAAPVQSDIVSSSLARAFHLMDLGLVQEAMSEFGSAYEETADEAAGFGWALLRLLAVPGLTELNDFYQSCGQPDYTLGDLFGTSGLFARERERGEAPHTLELGRGFDVDDLVVEPLRPTRVVAELIGEAQCYDSVSESYLPDDYLQFEVVDPQAGDLDSALTLTLALDATAPSRSQSGSLVELLAAGDPVEIAISDVNGYVEARVDTGAQVSSDYTGEIGLYEPHPIHDGMLRITSWGANTGDTMAVEVLDLVLRPMWDVSPPEVLQINGTATPALSESVEPELPFFTFVDEDTIGQLLADCSAVLDEAKLKSLLATVTAELDAIGDILVEASAEPDFEFEASLGLFGQPGVVVLGRGEGYLLGAVTEVAAALNVFLRDYRWFNGDLRTMIADGTVTDRTDCNPCTDVCSESDRVVTVFAPSLLLPEILDVFLNRDSSASDLTPMRDHLGEAIDRMVVALDSGTARTVLSFNRGSSSQGAQGLIEVLGMVRLGLTASSVTDGARIFIPGDEGEDGDDPISIFLMLDELFVSPPDATSMREDAEVPADDPAWVIYDEYSCAQPCTNEAKRSLEPADWIFEGLFKYIGDDTVTCTDPTECSFVDGATCSGDGECVYPEPSPAPLDQVGDQFFPDEGMPGFLNRRATRDIEAAIDL